MEEKAKYISKIVSADYRLAFVGTCVCDVARWSSIFQVSLCGSLFFHQYVSFHMLILWLALKGVYSDAKDITRC